MYLCFEIKLTFALFLRHFERFRSAKVSSEPAPSKIFKIPKVSNAVKPWCSVFRYCPFDFCYAACPKPRNCFPQESVTNQKTC